jgi:hypothetical protein
LLPACVRREKVRQLELPTHLSSAARATLTAPSVRPGAYSSSALASQALSASAEGLGSSAGSSAQAAAATAAGRAEVQMQLNQDLVGAMVKLDSASRRLEVLEREKARLSQSLIDSQVRWLCMLCTC